MGIYIGGGRKFFPTPYPHPTKTNFFSTRTYIYICISMHKFYIIMHNYTLLCIAGQACRPSVACLPSIVSACLPSLPSFHTSTVPPNACVPSITCNRAYIVPLSYKVPAKPTCGNGYCIRTPNQSQPILTILHRFNSCTSCPSCRLPIAC